MSSGSTDLAVEEAQLAARREPYARVTVVWARRPVSAKPGDTALVTADGRLRGWVGGSCGEPTLVREALAALAEGSPRLVHLGPGDEPLTDREGVVRAPVTCASQGSLEVFVEPHLPRPQLVVVGRSPLVTALAGIAAAIDFEVTVVERDGVGSVDAPAARVIGELDLAKAGVGSASYVVVATMGRYDEDALEAVLATGAGYVALVASPRRAAAVRDSLRAAGVPAGDLARVRAPAGLDLGPLPHREIAVAVLAEIVVAKAAAAPLMAAAAPAELAEAVDPVCGMTVTVGGSTDTVDYDGRAYWFCCAGCRRRFAQTPEQFLAAT